MQLEKILLAANTSWIWKEYIPDYPVSSFKIRIILKSGNGSTISIDSVEDGNSHLFIKDIVDTANLTAGLYAYQASAISLEDENKIYPIDFGVVEVQGDITQADARSFALKMVENLRAALLELSTKSLAEFSIILTGIYPENNIEELPAGKKFTRYLSLTIFLLLTFILGIYSCKDDPVTPPPPPLNPPDYRKINLSVEDVSCTQVWLKISLDSIVLSAEINLELNNTDRIINLFQRDTVLFIDSL